MIHRKELFISFACNCCGKLNERTYNLLREEDQPPICPPSWHYIEDDVMVCPSCWTIFQYVSKIVK
jgi:hypothetical protein